MGTYINKKSIEDLNNLTTPRLLGYYKAERKRKQRFVSTHTCDCGCGETDWDLKPSGYKVEKQKNEEWGSQPLPLNLRKVR